MNSKWSRAVLILIARGLMIAPAVFVWSYFKDNYEIVSAFFKVYKQRSLRL